MKQNLSEFIVKSLPSRTARSSSETVTASALPRGRLAPHAGLARGEKVEKQDGHAHHHHHARGLPLPRGPRVHRLDALQDLVLLGAYEAWAGSHSGLARNVETTLYVAPQLVPKRVMEPEVATQFGYSLMGLLHLYRDYVLWKKESADKDPPTGSHKQTRLVRVPLSLISHVQVLAEVVARRVGGDVGKWRLIVLTKKPIRVERCQVTRPVRVPSRSINGLSLLSRVAAARCFSCCGAAPTNASSSFDSLLQSTRLLADAGHTVPELRPQIKSTLALLATYYCTAMTLGTNVFMLAAGAFFYSDVAHSCQLGIALMFASISLLVAFHGHGAHDRAQQRRALHAPGARHMYDGRVRRARVLLRLARRRLHLLRQARRVARERIAFTMSVVLMNLVLGALLGLVTILMFQLPSGQPDEG
ncbi:hypothetical protein PF004_g24498 [Phytophthora fragariae]|uniref:Peroxisomal membrane protein PEX16 n=2 Tax=Phytophthora fragariae TaxID=53985 RepID=A0A6A3DPD6_9STRA|nr:hypothetical protein PF009_g26012 [Phytophthora fragariae]KAE9181587.1 hypothetical protein PF004_g24498 [Phytophthora fragariae]